MDPRDPETIQSSVLTADRPAAKSPRNPSLGLAVEPTFCPTDVADPFDTVEWEMRTAAIKGEGGEVLFEQKDCEIPSFWSQLGHERRGEQVFLRRERHRRAREERPAA